MIVCADFSLLPIKSTAPEVSKGLDVAFSVSETICNRQRDTTEAWYCARGMSATASIGWAVGKIFGVDFAAFDVRFSPTV